MNKINWYIMGALALTAIVFLLGGRMIGINHAQQKLKQSLPPFVEACVGKLDPDGLAFADCIEENLSREKVDEFLRKQ